MSLTFNDKKGRILCKITNGKLKNKVVYVVDNDEEPNSFKSLDLTDGEFQQIPDINTSRSVCYITGASGSGKSTYISNYAKFYKRFFKDNQVYVFSALKDDESLDHINPKRFRIEKETILDDKIEVEDLSNSLVIFDDIDCISDKNLKNEVYNILNGCLEVGRHFKISVFVSNHLPSAGFLTRRILNESHSITYFPHSGNNGKLKKFLIDQIGLSNQDYLKNKNSKSRWTTIFKNYPMVNMTQKSIRLLNDDD